MRGTPVLCFILLLFMVLMHSAYGSKGTAEASSQNQSKVMHGRINGWSKVENQRRHQGLLHVVQHAGSGGKAINGAHPRAGRRSSANSLSIRRSSLFMATFRHLSFGLLLLVCFY